ncbi:MAG: glycoside hydrolase family 65 protein [Solirubrobacterales bacterium]
MSDAVAAGAPTLRDWSLVYEGFDPGQEPLREAVCALGNGRFASRGAAPEGSADGTHYPGTYAAGLYNRLTSEVAGREVDDESIVNLPNWLHLTFRIEDGEWFDVREVELVEYRQELDLRRAVLTRRVRFRDAEGRETAIVQHRLVSMANANVFALQTTLLPVNWSGLVTFRSALDGRVSNDGVARYRGLASHHLVPIEARAVDSETVLLEVETSQSRIRVAEAARTRLLRDGEIVSPTTRVIQGQAWIGLEISSEVIQGREITAEKVATVYTSREPVVSEPGLDARSEVVRLSGFDELLSEHLLRWDELWNLCSLELEDRQELVPTELRLHIFHLLGNISEHAAEIDAGVPARGLAGEAYRGHVFWDALFVFPFLNLRLPDLSRALLRYRYRRLNSARWAAREAGYDGAMYPWQSGSRGAELTPTVHLNPRSGHWTPDNSKLQRHINAAIAYDVWLYHQATNDIEFLALCGAELFIELARFWASIATYDPARDRYLIRGVVGPDEYHDAYPGSERPGIDNNAYTNAMAAWVLWRVQNVLDALPEQRREQLSHTLGFGREELDRWDEISRKLLLPFHDDGILSQFEGYEQLEELDWQGYRARYGNIQRLDRILEAEGDSPNRYKASKQADVLMLFYLLSADELRTLFARLGYPFEYGTIPKSVEYYSARTSHGSTLSKVVHAWVLVRSDRERAWKLFSEALQSDLLDLQGGTTAEGVHLGAMAGTVDLVQRAFTGLETREEVLWLDPRIPEELARLRLKIRYRRHWGLEIEITRDRIRISARPADIYPIRIGIRGEIVELRAGASVERAL